MKRPRGRPRGYVAPGNCAVLDAGAFVALFRLLREYATPIPRGSVTYLAYVLDVSHVLVLQYCRKAPHGISPMLFKALERSPLLVQRQPFPFEEFYGLLERAVDATNADGARAPHTAVRWLPPVSTAVDLKNAMGAAVHLLRETGRIDPKGTRHLPRDQWLRCTAEEAAVLRTALAEVPSCDVSERRDGPFTLLLLHRTAP